MHCRPLRKWSLVARRTHRFRSGVTIGWSWERQQGMCCRVNAVPPWSCGTGEGTVMTWRQYRRWRLPGAVLLRPNDRVLLHLYRIHTREQGLGWDTCALQHTPSFPVSLCPLVLPVRCIDRAIWAAGTAVVDGDHPPAWWTSEDVPATGRPSGRDRPVCMGAVAGVR